MWSQSRSNRCHRSEQCDEQTEPLLLLGPYGGGQPRQGAFIPVRCTLHIQFLHPINNNRVQKLEWRVGWETPMQGTPPPLHGPSTVEPADPREHQPGGFNSSAGVCVALRHRYIWYRVCLNPPQRQGNTPSTSKEDVWRRTQGGVALQPCADVERRSGFVHQHECGPSRGLGATGSGWEC